MYVGQTSVSISERWRHHCTKGNLLYSAIKKYGRESFDITVLAQTESKVKLDKFERLSIKKLNTLAPNGYNLREGGESGFSPSLETREKLRKANIGKPTGRHIDYTNKKIGNITILKLVEGVTGINYKHWIALCDCGVEYRVASYSIRRAKYHACYKCTKSFYSKNLNKRKT